MTLSDDDLGALSHERLVFNAPLSAARADDLLLRLTVGTGGRALDLGCGWGELLLRLCSTYDIEGDGLELVSRSVLRAREAAAERGLEERVRFHEADVRTWHDSADIVISVGASHAWGGQAPMLAALRELVLDGGLVLIGEGIWEREPTPAASELFGELPDLLELTDLAVRCGFRPVHVGASNRDEFDTWESDWRAGLELSPEPQARAMADARRTEYLRVYRGVLGFAWLVLAPA